MPVYDGRLDVYMSITCGVPDLQTWSTRSVPRTQTWLAMKGCLSILKISLQRIISE